MIADLDPAAIRSLTARLVACRSVSPDVPGETRCAREIGAALPPGVERGEWKCRDGRPVVWAHVPGRGPRTVVLLAHYDTVGVAEFDALESPGGVAIAFEPAALRERLIALARAGRGVFDAEGLADVETEAREPGTWMFGRGALDMKSGVAIGVALIRASAALPEPLACGVLLVVTPDEENESAGVIVATRELRRFRDDRGADLLGVLNLDSAEDRAAYVGAMGKLELVCYVLGRPSHAGTPFEGLDATALAAEIVCRVTRSRALVDEKAGVRSVPAVALRLRDLKDEYNVQTAREAWAEFNLITVSRSLERTFEALRAEVVEAARRLRAAQLELAAWFDPTHAERAPLPDPATWVMTYPELQARAGGPAGQDPMAALDAGERTGASRRRSDDPPVATDARAATLERLRALTARAGMSGPAVVLLLVPPYYPHAAPGDGLLARAVRAALAGERVAVKPYYPHISDACYASWREDSPQEVASHMPSLGREYHLPFEEARALDLDVVSLGPWGRDAHGLLERVHAGWTFERLPTLLWSVLSQVSALASGEPVTREERA